MKTSNEKSIAAITHLSSLSQYLVPFGNYIFPLLIWTFTKDKSKFVNYHGKQVLNFQLSYLLYSLLLLCIAIPAFVIGVYKLFKTHYNSSSFELSLLVPESLNGVALIGFIALLLFVILKFSEVFLTLYAAFKSADGKFYSYPLTFRFIK